MARSLLDPGQIIKTAFNDTTGSLKTSPVSGALVTDPYDTIVITYITVGNGAGSAGTVQYYSGGLAGTLVATLTLSYNASNQLTNIVKS